MTNSMQGFQRLKWLKKIIYGVVHFLKSFFKFWKPNFYQLDLKNPR